MKTESGLEVERAPWTGGYLVIKSAGGKDLACSCTRVLYWEDTGKEYRAVCCDRPRFERKAGE